MHSQTCGGHHIAAVSGNAVAAPAAPECGAPTIPAAAVRLVATAAALLLLAGAPAGAMSLKEAVERTIETNPAIEAARANRRATEYELRQAEGRRFPLVDLNAEIGPEKIDKPRGLALDSNDEWRARRQAGLTVRQYIFDGFDRANDIYKQAARVDAAALRVLSRSEALALDAVEAFIDVGRNKDVLVIAQRNIRRQRDILAIVRDLERGGRATRSEGLQMQERVAAAEVAYERVRESLLEAEAKFHRVVGIRPPGLGRATLPGKLPATRQQAVDIGRSRDPNIAAAIADADAAKVAFNQTESALYPSLSVELRGSTGADIAGTPGRDNELAGRLLLSWNLFDGNISRNRRLEFANRWQQALAERDEHIRTTTEQIERAIASLQVGTTRLAALRQRQSTARQVVTAYEEEYKATKRTLIELLDAESAKFNAEIDVTSAEAVRIFSAYRLLGAMGKLLEAFGLSAPSEAYADKRSTVKHPHRFPVHLEPLKK